MADALATLQPVKERWALLSLPARFGILAAILVALGLAAQSLMTTAAPADSVLFSNLAEADAARIVERLRTAQVPYALGTGGTTILVPADKVYETRLLLAGEGLPSGGGVGFEVFDTQRFGESELAEQVKYHRALEGELARTVSHLDGVERARVHLVLPARALFASADQVASASVVLHLAGGRKLRDDQVKGIVHLIASSVRGLSADRVTLVDGAGKRLDRGGLPGTEGEGLGDVDSYRRDVEGARERAAQQILDTTLGPGKSLVRVAAEVSFTREEWTEERFDPEGTATRSFQVSEEREGSAGKAVGGVPGTPSNLPGGEPSLSGPSTGGGGLARRSETRNFEISKTLRRGVEPVGQVKGLQVAVVVDGKWTGTGAKKTFQSLPKAELDRIAAIVESAVGVDKKRGDSVLVECVAFAEQAPAEGTGTEAIRVEPPYVRYAAMGGGAVLAVVLLLLARKALRARPVTAFPTQDAMAALGLGNKTERLLGPVDLGKTERALAPGVPAREDTMEQVRLLAAELATQEPDAAARVLRGWLGEGSDGT